MRGFVLEKTDKRSNKGGEMETLYEKSLRHVNSLSQFSSVFNAAERNQDLGK